MISFLLAAAIALNGLTSPHIRARAFFDANNVRCGDPLVLTLDFIGKAEDFFALHPPRLAKAVDRTAWKVDDVSAKTETFRDGRRFTYRVRPLREGVLWFPELEFTHALPLGGLAKVKANPIPVHVKRGVQVEMAAFETPETRAPELDALHLATEGVELSADERFAWRKACAKPSADAFAAFDFPAARLNEAHLAIEEGNWARALAIYRRLEWRLGQTEEIERGIRAALALRYDNPEAELPVWRVVLRPLLRYPWWGRAGLVVGVLALLALIGYLLSRGIRAVAALAIMVGLATSASAQGFFSNFFGRAEPRESVKVTASAKTSVRELQVGTPFDFLLAVEAPATSTLSNLQISHGEVPGLSVIGEVRNLGSEKVARGAVTNVVLRLAVPVRCDFPIETEIGFVIRGMVSGQQNRAERSSFFSFSFSNSFEAPTAAFPLSIRPLPTDGQPADFSGIIAESLRIHETLDLLTVETNDVISINYTMHYRGFVPADFVPPGAAYERHRENDGSAAEYRRYFVADGAPATPKTTFSYFDARTRSYRSVSVGGTKIKYAIMEGKSTEAR